MPNDSPVKRTTRSGSTSSAVNLNDIKTPIDNMKKEMIATVKNDIDALKTTITSLEMTIAEPKSKNCKLQEKCNDITEEIPILKNERSQQPSSIAKIADKLEDRERRCRNFVVSGIPESQSRSREVADEEDSHLC